ncbi:MAG: pyridoxal phosphate-dependent aminotransferase [Anaerolineae bacterium]|nr:pyridoxal phosphate-dependent aminotransferase [Anaerolineae bacterium]
MTFKTTPKSPTLRLNEQSRLRAAQGQTVYRMGFGESPFMPPIRVQQALQESAHRKDYAPVQGLVELRQEIASFHSHVDGYAIDAQQVYVGSGSKILLFNTLLAFESAVVLIPTPAWVSYAPQAELIGHHVHRIPTTFEGRWHITPAALEAILSQDEYADMSKILILNYPGNPDGLTYTATELEDIAHVLRKHQAWVISDEIYACLHHQGQHISIAQYYPERTVTTTGLSKWCGAGGWRLGVQILPKDAPVAFVDAILGIASETFSCAPTPIQVAACQAYVWDDVTDHHLQQQHHILSRVGNHIQQILSQNGIAVHPPEGGFYLLLDFSPLREKLAGRGIQTDTDLCLRLLETTGVALLPGTAFGISPSDLTARLAYVDFSGIAIQQAISQSKGAIPDQELFDVHCAHMSQGIHALVDWLT